MHNSSQIDLWHEALKYPETIKGLSFCLLQFGNSGEVPFWRSIGKAAKQ